MLSGMEPDYVKVAFFRPVRDTPPFHSIPIPMVLRPHPVLEDWRVPAMPPRLAPGEVHLWKLSPGPTTTVEDLGLLSTDERARFTGMGNAATGAVFAAFRAAQRRILGAYLDRPAAALEFRYGPRGKPWLIAGPHFNLSHCGPLGLLAVTWIGAIGVDLEQVRERAHALDIARRLFGTAAWERLAALPPEARKHAFLDQWTCLEARLKAQGLGLFQARQGPDAQTAGLTGHGFVPHPGYQGCLALLGVCPEPPDWRCFRPLGPSMAG